MHVDRGLPINVFQDETFRQVLAGIRRRQPASPPAQAEPITLPILQQIVNVEVDVAQLSIHDRIDELNIVAAITTAYGGFLRSGEFTYDAKDLKDKRTFEHTSLLRSDVTFSNSDDHVVIALKRSKTDYEQKGVAIVVAASSTFTCPVQALRRLFAEDPQPPYAPLFRFSTKVFLYRNFVTALRSRISNHNIPNSTLFTGHSLRRGAATSAKLHGMLDSDIQRLGRWTSEAFQRYIDTDISYRFRLSH